jgi:SAM-dependent methyltransferase
MGSGMSTRTSRRFLHSSVQIGGDPLVDDLESFYLGGSNDDTSLFDIWEAGAARGDSTTPSICSESYRATMIGLLERALTRAGGKRVLSLGCGNGVIEKELLSKGYEVLAVDALEPAVELARKKGVPAVQGDVRRWRPSKLNWDVVYADGLMGHLYDEERKFGDVLARFRAWLKPARGSLVISNDVPQAQEAPAQAAPGVHGFYWLSVETLARGLESAGFDDVRREELSYSRPLSGPRRRAIIMGTA